MARSTSVGYRRAISSSSSQAARACGKSPAARAISTCAGSNFARSRGPVVALRAPRIAAQAFSGFPWASQQRESRLRVGAPVGRHCDRPPRPPRTRPAGDGSRPADRTPRRPACARQPAKRAGARGTPPSSPPPRRHGTASPPPIDQAAPGKGHHLRSPLAPLAQRKRPLPRAAQREHLLARRDHTEIDQPRQIGESSPPLTATIASSSSSRPRSTCPVG